MALSDTPKTRALIRKASRLAAAGGIFITGCAEPIPVPPDSAASDAGADVMMDAPGSDPMPRPGWDDAGVIADAPASDPMPRPGWDDAGVIADAPASDPVPPPDAGADVLPPVPPQDAGE